MSLSIPPLPPFQPEWPDFQVWWQLAKTNIEEAQNDLADQFALIAAAQADADAAAADAAAAALAAAGAQADATSALSTLTSLSADNVLSVVEKKQLIPIVQRIIDEKSGIDAQATTLGITTEKTDYDTKYTALVTTYLGGLSPAYNDTSASTTVVRSTFNTKFQDFYLSRQTLLNKIDDTAYGTATAAVAEIANITSDSILDKSEKAQLIVIVDNIINEKSGLDTQATALGITTEKTTYDTKYTALVTTYLGGLSPAYTDTTQNTTIVRATFNTKFTDYYTARQALLNKIDAAASQTGVVIDPFAEVKIYADSSGTVKSGQLPKSIAITASNGTANVTTAGTWSRTATSGVTCTIGASTGILNITALTVPNVKLPISFTYSGVPRTATVSIIRADDPPTNTGGTGGGTSASTTTLGDTTGTAYDTTNSVSDTLTVTTGSVGQVACSAPVVFSRLSGTGTTGAFGKWQWRVPAGVWADITTEVQEGLTSTSSVASPDSNTEGYLSVNHTKTGLAASTTYEFRFLWRERSVSGATAHIGAFGTMTATGT